MERDKQEEQGMPRERKLSTDARTHVRTVQVLADSLLADNLFLAESLFWGNEWARPGGCLLCLAS